MTTTTEGGHSRLPADISPTLHYLLMPLSIVVVVFSTLALLPIFTLCMLLVVPYKALSLLPGVNSVAAWSVKKYHQAIAKMSDGVLTDPRDEPILAAVLSVALVVVPLLLVQLVLVELNYFVLVAYYSAVFGVRMRNYVRSFSAMHQEGHRPGGILHGPSWCEQFTGSTFFYTFLALSMGIIPHSVAHAQQHHKENTGPRDLYASARYDHANLWHFFRYMVRDLTHQNLMTTPFVYFWRRGKRRQAWAMVKGNLAFLVLAAALAMYSVEIAFYYLMVPWGASNFLLGIIHWIQHSFYGGQKNPEDFWVNTVTLKEAPENFLNEGLHLCHHHRAGVHWSQSPELLEAIRPRMKEADSIVFKDLGVVELYLYLTVFRWFGKLAEKLEPWEPMTREEKIAHLKMRSRRAPEFMPAHAFSPPHNDSLPCSQQA